MEFLRQPGELRNRRYLLIFTILLMQEILHRLIGSVYPTTLLSFQCSTSHNNFAHNPPHLRFTIFVHASFTERERRIDVRASTWKLLETLASTIIHRQTKKTASVSVICENVTSPSQSKCPSVKNHFKIIWGWRWLYVAIWCHMDHALASGQILPQRPKWCQQSTFHKAGCSWKPGLCSLARRVCPCKSWSVGKTKWCTAPYSNVTLHVRIEWQQIGCLGLSQLDKKWQKQGLGLWGHQNLPALPNSVSSYTNPKLAGKQSNNITQSIIIISRLTQNFQLSRGQCTEQSHESGKTAKHQKCLKTGNIHRKS